MENSLNKNIFTNPVARVLLALFTCFLWGAAFPAIKIGFQLFDVETNGDKILFAGYRFFLAGVLTLVVISVLEKKLQTIKLQNTPYVFLQGLLQTTMQYVLFYIGLSYTTGTKGSIINGVNGLWAIIFAHFLVHDKITLKKIIGCIIGFIGVVVVNMEGTSLANMDLLGSFSFRGEGLVFLCSMSFGLSNVTMKMISDKEKPNTITAYQLIMGGAVLIIIGKILGGDINTVTPKSAFCMLILVLISTVAFTIWANLLKYNPVGKVSIFGFSIPVFGVLLSVLFLRESALHLPILLALICVSIGIIIVNKEKTA